jgi:WD40 repeat protein
MNDQPKPSSADGSQPAADTLRRIWSKGVPDSGSPSLVSSRDKVVLGTGQGWYTDLSGSLVVLDANTGVILRENYDYWQVYSLALSTDGRWLAVSDHPNFSSGHAQPGDADRIRILDVDTGNEQCRHIGELPSGTHGLVFSPDGLSVAAMGDQNPLVFDAANGRERWRIHLDGAFGGIAWSPSSASVAVGSRNGVAVLDGRFGSQRVLAQSPSLVSAVAYSPGGNQIVAGCIDGTIRVFTADNGASSWSKQVSESAVVSVAVSDDESWVAGISRDKVLAVYDLLSGTPRYPPAQCDFPNDGNRVLFSPTLRHILAMDFGSATSVINARTGRLAHTCPGPSCLIPSDGGAIAAFGSYGVERYDLGIGVSRHEVGSRLASIDMSPIGRPLVAVADTSSAVTVIAASTSGTWLARQPIPGTIASTVFADGGQAVATGGSKGVRLFSIVGERRWTVDTIGPVNALAAGPAGEWIATAAGRTVRSLSSADGHTRWPNPNTHPQTVTRIASSHDGKWIATGCTDRKTRIIDALTGAETLSVDGSNGNVEAVVFQPNGSLLATGNGDGTVVLIDAATASVRSRVTRLFGCSRIAFSFDGALLAAAWDDNTVSIFDINTSSSSPPELRKFDNFATPISGLAFNPADNSVAVATAGASVVVYDARDGIELVRILQPTPVSHFAFSADGALIATAGDDGIVQVWTSGSAPTDRMIKGRQS